MTYDASDLGALPSPVDSAVPPTALAPMRDISTLSFMTVIDSYASPDYYFTEFFRVHAHSRLDAGVLSSITENKSGRPVFAQIIGESLPDLERTVRDLSEYSEVAGVDLNLGCPAPKVYKKNVGGGLLRDPSQVDEILCFLRECVDGLFTVKMRIGFDDTSPFEAVLDAVERNRVDSLTIHGRTVAQKYRGDVDYGLIRAAAQRMTCPVFANGNIDSVRQARKVYEFTGCHGLMIGRGAIRNPWIFRQIRESFAGQSIYLPTLRDVRGYVEKLFHANWKEDLPPRTHLGIMKKFLNFVAQGVDAEGAFMHEMRRARTPDHLLEICDTHLLGPRVDELYASEPYEGLVARPNCE